MPRDAPVMRTARPVAGSLAGLFLPAGGRPTAAPRAFGISGRGGGRLAGTKGRDRRLRRIWREPQYRLRLAVDPDVDRDLLRGLVLLPLAQLGFRGLAGVVLLGDVPQEPLGHGQAAGVG